MVANVLLKNTDDHARNHAMIFDISQNKWRLAPAFDVLPSLGSQGEQALGIGCDGRKSTINNLLTASSAFGLSNEQALERINTMKAMILEWEHHFAKCGISTVDLKLLKVIMHDFN